LGDGRAGLAWAEDAVVVTVSFDELSLAPGFTTPGEKAQVACAGKPLQLKLIEWEKDPPTGEMLSA
jgi:hypothetical protein